MQLAYRELELVSKAHMNAHAVKSLHRRTQLAWLGLVDLDTEEMVMDRIAHGVSAVRGKRVVLCRPLIGIGPNLVHEGCRTHCLQGRRVPPRRVTLPDIGPPSTEEKETFDLCGLIDRTKVKMESVLACLLTGTGTNNRPGTRSGLGLISNSAAASPTTIQPKASAHH